MKSSVIYFSFTMAIHTFKVWNVLRKTKTTVTISTDLQNLVETLILKASTKLDIDGSKLCLESDGTDIDEDDALKHFKNDIFLLLTKNEEWIDLTNKSDSSITWISSPIQSEGSSNIQETEGTEPILLEKNLPHETENNPQIINLEVAWNEFQVPWHLFTNSMLEMIEKKIRTNTVLTDIVHLVVDEMRKIKTNIPINAFRLVASKMAEKYPHSFQDRDEKENIIGSGNTVIAAKLEWRNNYLNRPHKRNNADTTNPDWKIRKLNSSVGAINWQPDLNNDEIDVKTIKKVLLKRTADDQIDFDILDRAYSSIRVFLNNIQEPPTVQSIKTEWPCLFDESVILWHFTKLTGKKLEQFRNEWSTKIENILTLSKNRKQYSKIKSQDPFLKSLEAISIYFKENIYSCIFNDKESLNTQLIMEPCLVLKDGMYQVWFQKEVVTECSTILNAFPVMYSLYYILNIQYPEQLSCSFEFMQRCFLGIHPDMGKKSRKRGTTKRTIIKYMTLLQKV